MADKYHVEPDLNFVKEVVGLGGDTLKKCFQCATCSVACPISPDNKPFPRKEMIAASWGLKDKLVANADIWLCHQCGDCSTKCPRGAAPGDVLGAIRSYAISEYATPQFLSKAVNDKKNLPLLFGVPAVIFAILALFTIFGGETLANIFGGQLWYHTHDGLPVKELAHSNFMSLWFVDLVFVSLATFVVIVFALGLSRFVKDIHQNALAEGKTDKKALDLKGILKALVNVIPGILKHDKFTECEENQERATIHMMVLYSFIALFIVTSVVFVTVYFFHITTPFRQINPIKILANIAGVTLVIGSALMIKNRLSKKDQVSTFKDWYLLGLVFGLGATGMLTEMARLANSVSLTYFMYYLHLILIFNLFAFLPFSKMAHLVYRTVAMAYANWAEREK